MKKFIVITGPTATGKTAISVALAQEHGYADHIRRQLPDI